MKIIIIIAGLFLYSCNVFGSSVGPKKNGFLEKLDYMSFVEKYLGYYDVSDEELEQLKLLSVREFNMFGKKGLLVCFQGGDTKEFLPEPQPYGFFVSKKVKYDTGGGDYLCELNDYIKKGNSDYEVMRKVTARYPSVDKQSGIEGNVILEYAIDQSGKAKNVWVVKEGPNPRFTQSAIEALSQFKYKPRIINGVPRSVYGIRQNFKFRIQ